MVPAFFNLRVFRQGEIANSLLREKIKENCKKKSSKRGRLDGKKELLLAWAL